MYNNNIINNNMNNNNSKIEIDASNFKRLNVKTVCHSGYFYTM